MAVDALRFEARGKTHRFKFGFAAICRLEANLDKPFGDIIAEMLPGLTSAMLEDPLLLSAATARLRHGHLGALIQAGLDDGDATEATVAEIIDDLGVERAIAVIFGGQANDLAVGSPASKKKAGAGRRKRSIPTR